MDNEIMNNPKIPTKKESLDILNKNKTPSNVIEHCKTVCKVAEEIADKLIAKGININKTLVVAAALLHDIEREKDNHIIAGAKLLKSMGFPEVAEVMGKHSLHEIEKEKNKQLRIEEKIMFYADKRVKENKIVSLKERIEDLEKRYNKNFSKEFEFAEKIEEELIR
ncbi:MAG: HDIG domain-containing protein [Candidatus Woesearchaeota archaeon]|jgi:putative nucleotidyltransferase with HDIG domain|nr:HDIG domain-containing protein [Candidatus Woesearchaeota archaeon]MDP6265940.1 HDIG domain-containing protein [Candidatus Woesearchaeota archaeon]MDP7322625.1 HDIG domain-containing protein [Candidatus Woesearchaeota archaeon]MDP7476232.1 HDIG domain-containing protein [Candidatus Woesearchaeota archaeon]HJO01847.1 HDIG domain-containing protein [Candidatus Woesearchaeota archaeon]|tara:strand:+ start:6018 stop:6515 length:498 start_codon:yes stop_codon:yes gene_type:complete